MKEWKYNDNELFHYGIPGMKWGVRKEPRSLGGIGHRILAANFALNERAYKALGNKMMAGGNAAAKRRQLQLAAKSDRAKAQRIAAKQKASEQRAAAKAAKPRRTLSGIGHRLLAANYRLNAKAYNALGNKAIANMNIQAMNKQLSLADAADRRKHSVGQDAVKNLGRRR